MDGWVNLAGPSVPRQRVNRGFVVLKDERGRSPGARPVRTRPPRRMTARAATMCGGGPRRCRSRDGWGRRKTTEALGVLRSRRMSTHAQGRPPRSFRSVAATSSPKDAARARAISSGRFDCPSSSAQRVSAMCIAARQALVAAWARKAASGSDGTSTEGFDDGLLQRVLAVQVPGPQRGRGNHELEAVQQKTPVRRRFAAVAAGQRLGCFNECTADAAHQGERGRRRGDPLGDGPGRLARDEDEVLLGGEVPVHGHRRDAGGVGDLGHRHRVVAAVGEQPHRVRLDHPPRLGSPSLPQGRLPLAHMIHTTVV